MTETQDKFEHSKVITAAIYTALAKCAREIEVTVLTPKEQITAYLNLIRELTLKMDDIVTDNLLEDSADAYEC